MAAFPNGFNIGDATTTVIALPLPQEEETLLADGAVLVGSIVKYSATAGKAIDAGANDPDAIGWVAAGWVEATLGDARFGDWVSKPGTSIASGQRLKIYHFQSGQKFWGLLPNGVTLGKGEQATTAASGRVTNHSDPVTAPEAVATYVRGLRATTAAADDAVVPLEVL